MFPVAKEDCKHHFHPNGCSYRWMDVYGSKTPGFYPALRCKRCGAVFPETKSGLRLEPDEELERTYPDEELI